MTLIHEPGSVREIQYFRSKVDGKYPIIYWGSVEEQIAEATAENLRLSSSSIHTVKPLYLYSEYCPHTNPEEDPKYDGLDDLLDEWMARNCAGLSSKDGITLWWKNTQRGYTAIPLYVEFNRVMSEYEDAHSGNVCLESPMGSCCEACTEGDEDFGFEPEACRRQEYARERWNDLWDRVSPEGLEDLRRDRE